MHTPSAEDRTVVVDVPDGAISATQAAKLRGLDRHTLVAAIQANRVRGYRVSDRSRGVHGVGYDVLLSELDADLAELPACVYESPDGENCSRPALGPSGGCAAHGHVLAGARARGRRRPDIGPKISASKMGHPTPPSARAKMAAAKRRYAPARCHCRWCGAQIKPRRPGLEAVSPELLSELGLDLVPGWVLRRGGGLFCDPVHATLWGWANVRGRYPQATMPGRVLWRDEMVRLWSGPHTASAKSFRAAWKEMLTSPVARKEWLPLWQALENAANRVGEQKGAAKGREVADAALQLIRARPTIARRDLIDALIIEFEGRTNVLAEGGGRRRGADPIYRAARGRIRTALRRGYELLDRPTELRPFS